MVENRTRSQQVFQKSGTQNPATEKKDPVSKKISGLIADVRNLFNKSQVKAASPAAKKVAAVFTGAFSAHKLDLKSINQVLALILIGLIALTVQSVLKERPDIASVTAEVSNIDFEPFDEKTITPFQELAFYSQEISKRDIFNEYEEPKPPPPPPVIKPVETKPEPPPPPKVTIQEKARNLKLLGISWGESPKVIIKNEGTQDVLFLKKGEKIKGTEIKVKDIMKNGAVLSSDGEEMKML